MRPSRVVAQLQVTTRPAAGDGERPGLVELGASSPSRPLLDVDAGGGSGPRRPHRPRGWGRSAVDHAGDPGVEEGLRARPGRSLPWHGSRVTTAVPPRAARGPMAARASTSACGAAGAAVAALADDGAVGVEEHAPTRGFGLGAKSAVRGEVERAAHRRRLRRAGHRRTLSASVAGPRARRASSQAGPEQSTRGVAARTCSRVASHPDSHRRSRSSTWSTGRWLRSGRGLSPPVRNCTDPGTHELLRTPPLCHADLRLQVGSSTCRSSPHGTGC